ncbi:MAG: HAD-IA family hydrolase [Leptospiraceae bacterium]|nr:HAD-IA family hydrolase [Leptospiraceae bacterium]
MRTKAIIFDLDGTLLDTLFDIANCTNMTLEAFGYPGHPVAAYKKFIGEGVTRLLERALLPVTVTLDEYQRLLARFTMHYREHGSDHACLYPGIAGLLDDLQARQIQCNILSNKPHPLTQAIVQELLSSWDFTTVLGQRDEVPRKPDPAAVFEIMARSDVDTTEYMFVGDTVTDHETARAAGIRSVSVLWGFQESGELQAAGASVLLQSPMELLQQL